MRRLILVAPLLALGTTAHAATRGEAPVDPAMAEMTRTLGDPVRQQAIAKAMGAMTDVMLDMPLAPILKPLAEAAGEDPRKVDRDATLRKMAPGAGSASRVVERTLPHAMDAMAGMGSALAQMLPQLREIADRMREAIPDALPAEQHHAGD